nr:uncharacterized protein LOC113704815 [Coffea arabica]
MIERGQGKLSSTIEVNPKEATMAITLYSRKVLDDPEDKVKSVFEKKNEVKVDDRSEKLEDEHDGLGKKSEDDQRIKVPEVKTYVSPIPFPKLKFANLVPTQVILQLADRSVRYPTGIVEDLLVKVGKFYLSADFIVLDMKEDISIPIVLDRGFLTTGGANIDLFEGKLTLRVGKEK